MRWVRRIAIGVGVATVVIVAIVYGASEWVLRRSYAAPLPALTAATDPAAIAEGGRLAFTFGCRGCHGPGGQGTVIADVPGVVHVAPSALARAVAPYSDRELARLVRYGVKRDGSALRIMPIGGHRFIADDDLEKLMGWLRSLRPSPGDRPDRLTFGPIGRVLLLRGAFAPELSLVSVAPARRPADVGPYLARSVCGGCHALHEQRRAHDDGRPVPALTVVAPAYDDAAFRRLLRTGVGLSPRDLGLMGRVGRRDLSHLTNAEIGSIHAFLLRQAPVAAAQ